MKQYTTPVVRMRLAGCGQLLSQAVKVETVFRRGSAECRVLSRVEGDCVVAALTEAQTGVLCSGPKGHVSAEVTVVGEGVAKSATFYFEAFPAVRSEGMGFVGAANGDGDGVLEIALEGEVYPVSGGYVLPAATGSALGGVMVGAGLSVDADGVLSAGVLPDDVEAIRRDVEDMEVQADGLISSMRAAVAEAELAAAGLSEKLAQVDQAVASCNASAQEADIAAGNAYEMAESAVEASVEARAAARALTDAMGGSY